MTDNKKINSRLDVIIITGIASGGLLLLACAVMFIIYCCNPSYDKPTHTPSSDNISLALAAVSPAAGDTDSLGLRVARLERRLALLHAYDSIQFHNTEQRQIDLIADVRQETNNSLEKNNAWLAFWITVMTLVGTLLPLVLNYKFSRDERIKIEEKIKELQTLQDNITNTLAAERKRVSDAIAEQQTHLATHEIQNIANTLYNCDLYRIDLELRAGNLFDKQMWGSMLHNARIVINACFEEVDTNSPNGHVSTILPRVDRLEALAHTLTGLHVMLDTSYRTHREVFTRRQYKELCNDIRTLLGRVISHRIYSSDLHSRLISLLDRLGEVNLAQIPLRRPTTPSPVVDPYPQDDPTIFESETTPPPEYQPDEDEDADPADSEQPAPETSQPASDSPDANPASSSN